MEITGHITAIMEPMAGTSQGGKEWKKRELVVEENESKFPNSIVVTAFNQKVDQIALFQVGDNVRIKFDVSARAYNGRYYNNVNLYTIEKFEGLSGPLLQSAPPAQPVAQPQQMQAQFQNPQRVQQFQQQFAAQPVSAGSDLPF